MRVLLYQIDRLYEYVLFFRRDIQRLLTVRRLCDCLFLSSHAFKNNGFYRITGIVQFFSALNVSFAAQNLTSVCIVYCRIALTRHSKSDVLITSVSHAPVDQAICLCVIYGAAVRFNSLVSYRLAVILKCKFVSEHLLDGALSLEACVYEY